ncbi:MAG: hypothetical protein AAGF11_03315 [Myxococcota bacterium]
MNASLLVALLALAAPQKGEPKGEAARQAEAAFEAGDYKTAISAARQAYIDEGDPVYLYVQAQAERFGGRCDEAIVHYREFVQAVPQGPAANAARDNITECEQALAKAETASASEPDPVAPLGPLEPDASSAEDPSTKASSESESESGPSDRDRSWIRDPWGGALVGVGVVALAVGGGFYGQARRDAREARAADNVVTYGEQIDRAIVLSRAGIPVMAAGGALVVAGVVRWIVVARRGATAERLTLRPGGFELRF